MTVCDNCRGELRDWQIRAAYTEPHGDYANNFAGDFCCPACFVKCLADRGFLGAAAECAAAEREAIAATLESEAENQAAQCRPGHLEYGYAAGVLRLVAAAIREGNP